MATGALWHSRPIFITSTFRDMQAERDWLRDRVFPALEERLRARRTHLEPIDLRWGVETVSTAEEEAKELLVLKVCLAEVERSRPFLIGLLGDRYGWVPPEARLKAAAREAGFDESVAGRSVTDLEIDFGVLSSTEQRRRCRFYFREPLPYAELIASGQMTPETAAEFSEAHRPGEANGSAQLIAMKQRIDVALPDRVRHYRAGWDADRQAVTGLEAWGEQVLEDLWQDLAQETAEWARAGETSWQAAGRFTLEQFIEDRTRDFVGREAILTDLESLATSSTGEGQPWGACVTAGAGAGKSALFAALSRRLHGNDDIIVLAHAAGISPESTQVDRLLRRWIGELAEIAGVTDPLTEDAKPEEVEQTFHSMLGRVSTQRRVLLLLDALNQFEPTPRARHLTWLPKLWPPNACLIATTIPGTQSEALSQRPGTHIRELPPLDASEAASIATTICRRYRRTLHPDVLERLLQKQLPDQGPAAGNALWLRLAVEELNLLDADDFARLDREFTGTAEQKLHQLLLAVVDAMPADVESLYGWLLERAEQLHGKVWTQAFVNLIAVSRAGWRESDFRALIPKLTSTDWNELAFAALRRTFRAHVVQRGAHAQWDFAHAQLRLEVERRNLASGTTIQTLHRLLADHLESLPTDDLLHESETLVHLIGAGDSLRAAQYYAGERSAGELVGATAYLAQIILKGNERLSNADDYQFAAWLRLPDLSDAEQGVLCHRSCHELYADIEKKGFLGVRKDLLQAVEKALTRLLQREPDNIVWQRDFSVSQDRLGDIRHAQGDLLGALHAYESGLTISERLAAENPDEYRWQVDLSIMYGKVGDILYEQGDLSGALNAYQTCKAIEENLSAAGHDALLIQYLGGGSSTRIRAGNMQFEQGDLSGAQQSYSEALDIIKRLALANPGNAEFQREWMRTSAKLADVLASQGNHVEASVHYAQSLIINENLVEAYPDNVQWRKDLAVSHSKLGVIGFEKNHLSSALAHHQKSLEILKGLVAEDPDNLTLQHMLSVPHGQLGEVQQALGDLVNATISYSSSIEISSALIQASSSGLSWQHELGVSYSKLGEVLEEQGDIPGAITAYREGLAISERLSEVLPDNANWRRDLVVSYFQLANVSVKDGDNASAQNFRMRCHQALLGMKQSGMFLDPPLVRLFEQLDSK